jgi:hypothetical protein
MVTHSSTSRPVQCLCMAERTGCPVFTDLWPYVLSIEPCLIIKNSQRVETHDFPLDSNDFLVQQCDSPCVLIRPVHRFPKFRKYDSVSRAIVARVAQPPHGGSRVTGLCYPHCCKDIIPHAHKPGMYRYISS